MSFDESETLPSARQGNSIIVFLHGMCAQKYDIVVYVCFDITWTHVVS